MEKRLKPFALLAVLFCIGLSVAPMTSATTYYYITQTAMIAGVNNSQFLPKMVAVTEFTSGSITFTQFLTRNASGGLVPLVFGHGNTTAIEYGVIAQFTATSVGVFDYDNSTGTPTIGSALATVNTVYDNYANLTFIFNSTGFTCLADNTAVFSNVISSSINLPINLVGVWGGADDVTGGSLVFYQTQTLSDQLSPIWALIPVLIIFAVIGKLKA